MNSLGWFVVGVLIGYIAGIVFAIYERERGKP